MGTVLGARWGTAYGDGWVRSACTICMNRCGILAHQCTFPPAPETGWVDSVGA